MSRIPSYLLLSRHSVWYFRLVVPEAIRPVIGQREIRRSLKTRSKLDALIRGRTVLMNVQRAFTDAYQGLKPCLKSICEGRESVDTHSSIWTATAFTRADSDVHSVTEIKVQPKLSKVLQEYLVEQEQQKVSGKTISDKRSVINLFIKVLGDKSVDQYSREDTRKFKRIALQLPPRMGQLPAQSIKSMIATENSTISTTTFNNYIKNLTTLFGYAKREGYVDLNPVEGLKVKSQVKQNTLRSRYTDADLKQIFSYTAHQSFDKQKAHRYWLPLLGLLTGARLNELCQLYLDDVVKVEGYDCIHIRAARSDQKIKNLSSERLIPIHSKLLELGFLSHVESMCADGHERVFPELVRHSKHGYSNSASRWFSRVRGELGFKEGGERKDFHSFRHTVADQLKQLGIPESVVGGILGHQTGGITFNRYGKDYSPHKLANAIEQLQFDVL